MMRRENVTGVILAGGRGLRIEGMDKGFIQIDGKPLVEYMLALISPLVDSVLISANRSIEQYQNYGEVVTDSNEGAYWGPLAGIAAAMKVVKTPYLLVVAVDMPCLTQDILMRLLQIANARKVEVTVADDGTRLQNTVLVVATSLYNNISQYLLSGERKLETWITNQKYQGVDFSSSRELFVSVNSKEDLVRVAARIDLHF